MLQILKKEDLSREKRMCCRPSIGIFDNPKYSLTRHLPCPILSYHVGVRLKAAYTLSLTSSIRYQYTTQIFVLCFCIGIMKILEYCKEQGECSEKESTDLMKKYEIS